MPPAEELLRQLLYVDGYPARKGEVIRGDQGYLHRNPAEEVESHNGGITGAL